MANSLSAALERVHTGVGQGSVLEQIDKRYRKQQRMTLFQMLEKVDKKEVEHFPGNTIEVVPKPPLTNQDMTPHHFSIG